MLLLIAFTGGIFLIYLSGEMQNLVMPSLILKALKLLQIMENSDMTGVRHIVVDTMGNLLFVKVHSATILS